MPRASALIALIALGAFALPAAAGLLAASGIAPAPIAGVLGFSGLLACCALGAQGGALASPAPQPSGVRAEPA